MSGSYGAMGAEDNPGSVLFACNHNAVRSAMAEAIAKHLFGHVIYVDSVGVTKSAADDFAVAVLDEIGIDLSQHRPKTFDDLEDTSHDLLISLTPQAHHRAMDLTRTWACDVEYWPVLDPTAVHGNRDVKLDAYRQLRDDLKNKISRRFQLSPAPSV